jgi:glycine dehydrogenase subunit 1
VAVHKFLPNSEDEITKRMLAALGLRETRDLFSDIPDAVHLGRTLNIPESMSEIELEKLVFAKLSKNMSYPEYLSFLGGGASVHHIPAIIDEILSRGEFYTAYTPYQPEISQGMLQALFEYQSQICELTGMSVANSSMYDWGSAVGEAGRMAQRVTGRRRLLCARSVSPERLQILETYCLPAGIEVVRVGFLNSGCLDQSDLEKNLDKSVAAIYLEVPNFLGVVEDSLQEISDLCHKNGSLFIVGVDPITLGCLAPPSSYGADVVVGDGQSLGIYPNFGGPFMGIFAIKDDSTLLRQMPGRLIGATQSKDASRRGYTMVLQTREQHIRREHATSNICTNEALFALAVSIYLSCMGPSGMKEVGERIFGAAHYAKRRFNEEGILAPYFEGGFFGDLSLGTKTDSQKLSRKLVDHKILGGLPLGKFYGELRDVSLFSFSELHGLDEIERLVAAVKAVEEGA